MKTLLRLALLATAELLFADFAAADTIVSPPNSQSVTDLQAEIQALFGSSMPWTTAANIAEIDYLLGLASDSGGGDDLTAELQIVSEEQDSSGALPLDAPPAADSLSENPEPATLVLLGGGLFLLLWGATAISSIRRLLNTS